MLKVLATGLLLTGLYNFLVFNSLPGIGFSLFVVFINWVLFVFSKNPKNALLSYGFGIASCIFALLFSFRSNGVVQLIDAFSSIIFLLLNIYFSKSNLKFDFSYLNFLAAPFKAGLKFVEGFVQSLTPQTWSEHSANKQVTSSLLRGLFIGVPVLAVLFFILSKADPVFENITFSFLEDVWIRIIFSLIVFVSVLSLGILKIHESEKEAEVKEVSVGKEYELLIILGGLAVLFGGFIFIQFKYLFSDIGERELLSLGIKSVTYSEYVRKGFFELLLASAISSVLVLYVLRFIHKLKGGGKVLVQLFTSVVTIEVGLLLWSAAQRVFLYQAEHGLTRARAFGMFFLAWMAILLVILLIRVIRDLNNKIYLTLNIISTLVILLLVNIINVDELIATKYRPTVNNEIDYYYLTSISPEAHLSWVPAIQEAENVYLNLKDKTDLNSEDYRIIYWSINPTYSIKNEVDYLNDKYGSQDQVESRHKQLRSGMDKGLEKLTYQDKPLPQDVYIARKWQSLNLGEYLAYVYVKENSEQFNKLEQLTEGLRNIQNRINPEIINTTTLDRSTNPPLSN
jgi:hypothetical protein